MNKKVVVSIDDYIYRFDQQYYVDNVGFHVIARYTSYFDQVKIIARCRVCEDKRELGQFSNCLTANNLVICELPFFRGTSFIRLFNKLNKQIKKALVGYDYCIARIPSHTGFLTLYNAFRVKITTGAEIVANPYQEYKESGSKQSYIIYKVLCYFSRRVHGLLFVTKKTLQRYYDFHIRGQITVGISDVELNKSFFSLKHIENTPNTQLYTICHVSNIISGVGKGHYECMDILKRLKNKNINVRILFAGSYKDLTPYYEYAKKIRLNEKDICFVGFVGRNELRNLLLDSDFMLFPSHTEGLPRVLLEAMAVSLPCITSNVGGIPEIISTDSCFDYNDVEGMASRMIELINNRAEYEREAKRNYEEALKYEKENLQIELCHYFDQFTS